MSGHINFVENVYDTIKNPLTFICNKVNILTGAETMELTNVSYVDMMDLLLRARWVY